MVFIYTTCADMNEAKKLGTLIIDKKFGVCVDYWSVHSMYHFDGKLKEISQVMLLITTLESKLEDVNVLISSHHSYATPLIAGVDVRRMNRAYKEWMTKELS
ncbi:MAG: CutA1 divalent ion tolerance protein [Candidatus Nomurabacteria bacterium GW2011_GWA2_40_9]|uniref:CutA1 divalent ion tolerance protein n=1 Tax=Candidatus Nomurabacteria bacterium GW2011_GWA2_40_9 TaxID=1618734 RepID=A0A0G0TQR3_9BACT|nr:MAG: CutA1 divalent ion tolerance protein [Candidatus Nomurabacteria bacterium GW2011_GWA2_40_9]